jgi:EAL domain-containing protein (putative c-di-GMP-specific phosphodiesterase class I)
MDVGFGIEVTKTGPMMDHARAKVVIEECRRRGIRVGLDDFGTGSASLSHIQQLDIEHIKLDQSFVQDILSDERNMATAAGVITTARLLAKTVIAEGVETPEQGDLLASPGCHQLQVFRFRGRCSVGPGLGRRLDAAGFAGAPGQRASLADRQSGRPVVKIGITGARSRWIRWCGQTAASKMTFIGRAVRSPCRSPA